MEEQKIPKRILNSLISSIAAGVVPRSGAPYIAIGRADEIAALLSDLELINEGGSSMRFIIGKYGSGKSFLMQLIRNYAVERGFVCADCDLSPERRICGGKGTGTATYRELIKNLSSKTAPEGGALTLIVSKWLSELRSELAAAGFDPGSASFDAELKARVYALGRELEGQVGGFDFARVLTLYYEASRDDSDEAEAKRSACLRWLRGEFTTKTEARAALGVGEIIGDENWYDYIKLLAVFVKKIGYRGLVVFIDECVNLYKIVNRTSRENNYEKLLSMFNDALGGRAPGLAIILGGTPQFLEDPRRGLFSYEALRSRLADGRFANLDYKNILGPVIRLRRLSDDELLALIARITKLHGMAHSWEPRITTQQQVEFLKTCLARAGADSMITPREIIRDYMQVLNILLQNPKATFEEVMGSGVVTLKTAYDGGGIPAEAEFERETSPGNANPQKAFSLEDIEL